MPRIFKGSESTLRLLIHTCNQEGKISDLKIALYTNDPSMAVEFTDRYTIEGNIVSLTVPNYAFGTMEDGVINYVAQGMIDDDTFLTERQSNYFLKTPANYTPTPMPEEVVLGELTTTIVENGVFEYTPTDVDAWNKATIEVNVPDTNGSYDEGYKEGHYQGKTEGYETGYNDGYNQGQNDCPEGGSCNLEDKRITPSMGDRDDNGYIVVEESEEYDGLDRVVIDPITIYNEGVSAGKIEGSDLTIGTGDIYLTPNERGQKFEIYPSEWEYDAFDKFIVELEDFEFGGGCNLEDKWVTPSMGDRDDNGLIVVNPSEGYDGLSRTVIDPQTIYNEGIEEGKNQGGCNIQGNKTVELSGERMGIYPDEGYDGVLEVIVEAGRKAEEWREEGRNDIKNNLQSIEITENGRYSVEDAIYVESLRYNGGYHTDTISTYDINRIEVTFKADTSEAINGQGQPFILGGSLYGVNESGEGNACTRAIQYAFGRIVGYWEGKWTDAVSTMDGEWLTITLDENGMTVKYPSYENHKDYTHDNGHTNGGGDIFPFIIGGLGKRAVGENGGYTSNLIEDSQFRGLIKEVKINTNSMGEITYIPKDLGYGVWDRKVENTGELLSALEPTEGEVTFNGEWEAKYGEGWKEINVNIVQREDPYKKVTYVWLLNNGQDTSDALSSELVDKLRNDTIISEFLPGYPNSSYYKQGPLLIRGSYADNNITRIDNLVYNTYENQINEIKYCPVIYFGEMSCNNVQEISIDTFKYMNELRVVAPMVNLGESFKGEMIISFENCAELLRYDFEYEAEEFIKSLYDFSQGPNKEGVTTSFLKFHTNTIRSLNDNLRNWISERGWTLIEE